MCPEIKKIKEEQQCPSAVHALKGNCNVLVQFSVGHGHIHYINFTLSFFLTKEHSFLFGSSCFVLPDFNYNLWGDIQENKKIVISMHIFIILNLHQDLTRLTKI